MDASTSQPGTPLGSTRHDSGYFRAMPILDTSVPSFRIALPASPPPDEDEKLISPGTQPRKARRACLLFSLLFAFLLSVLLVALHSRGKPLDINNIRSFYSSQKAIHPILQYLQQARSKNNRMLRSQSKTYQAAVRQYKARYSRNPPRDFDLWWAFAQSRNHTLVDEYDNLMKDLDVFRNLPAITLQRRTRTLGRLPGVSLLTVKDGELSIQSKSGKWAPARGMQEMISAFVSNLPDFEFALNEKPEGRILSGRWVDVDEEDYPVEDTYASSENDISNSTDPLANKLADFKATWDNDGSVWEAYRRACQLNTVARRLVESVRSSEAGTEKRQAATNASTPSVEVIRAFTRRRVDESTSKIPHIRELLFQPKLDADIDICNQPSMHTLHSAFYSDTRVIENRYPLFSAAKAVGYADILIPSHQYWAPSSDLTYESDLKKGRSKEPSDVEWSQKTDKLFWRGKVTRGTETPPGHEMTFQKQRIISMANDDGGVWMGEYPIRTRVPAARPALRSLVGVNAQTSTLESVHAAVPLINNLTMDVAFACEPRLGECQWQQNAGFKIASPGPLSQAWQHKYVLDVDEVGASPKFLALMESKSAVLKSSIMKEFWQNWAIPWYHYIPVSSAYGEIYNIQSFFTGFPQIDTTGPSRHSASHLTDIGSINVITPNKNPSSAFSSNGNINRIQPVNPGHGDVFDGDLALRDIAEQGSKWKLENVRREDMEVYMYRLLIEWARLYRGEK